MPRGKYHRGHKRDLCELYLRLDVRTLARAGFLEPKPAAWWAWETEGGSHRAILKSTGDHLIVAHPTADGDSAPEAVWIPITTTRCHYGNSRAWWSCPGCQSRRAVLYLYTTQAIYCRQCLNLTYASTRESPLDSVRYKIHRLRSRLGPLHDGIEMLPTKPPRMHWKTFIRLRDELRALQGQYYGAFQGMLHRLQVPDE